MLGIFLHLCRHSAMGLAMQPSPLWQKIWAQKIGAGFKKQKNVYAVYYLQAVQRVRESVGVSLLHSFLLSGAFLYLLPVLFGKISIWYVMFFAELITAIVAIYMFRKSNQ